MHAFAIFAVNEHLAELRAEAARARLLRGERRGSVARLRAAVAALFAPAADPQQPLFAAPSNK